VTIEILLGVLVMLTFKSLPLALGFCLLSGSVISSELNTPRTVIRDNDNINVTARFPNGETGDLYLATVVNGKVMFITSNGLTEQVEPKNKAQYFEGIYPLLNTPASTLTPGVYPLYQVLTRTDGNPYNQADWIGTIAQMNFTVKMPDSVGRDYNRDGFPDDDVNHTGFHDESVKTGATVVNNTTVNSTPTLSNAKNTSENHNEVKNESENHSENHSENGSENHNNNTVTQPVVTTPTPVVDPVPTTTTPVVTTPEPTVVTTPVVTPPAVTTPAVSNTAAGQSLFNTSCSGCHGSPAGIRSAASATTIRNAINSNRGGMGMLKGMSDADLAAIASYVQSAP
jgi:hypothetical protein